MALKVVSMNELKLEVLLEPEQTGESVAEVCLRRGISRASYYRAQATRARGRAAECRPLPPADPRQARALPSHPE